MFLKPIISTNTCLISYINYRAPQKYCANYGIIKKGIFISEK